MIQEAVISLVNVTYHNYNPLALRHYTTTLQAVESLSAFETPLAKLQSSVIIAKPLLLCLSQ